MACTSAWRRPWTSSSKRSRRSGRTPRRRPEPAGLADAHPAHAKGWTGPKIVDGIQIEGPSGRIRCRSTPSARIPSTSPSRELDAQLPAEDLFDQDGRPVEQLVSIAPRGPRMSDNPHANGGLLLKQLELPISASTRSSASPGGPAPRRRGCSARSCVT